MLFIGILNWQKKMARKSWSVDVVNDYVIAKVNRILIGLGAFVGGEISVN